jgi:YHS domain-containing protein
MTRAFVVCLALTLTSIGCSSSEQQPAPAPQPAATGGHDHGGHDHGDHHAAPAGTGAALDPVCGMEVAAGGTLFVDEGGQRFPFCSAQCKARFQQDPHRMGQAFFDAHCPCKTTMDACDCGHCTGTFEPCGCGS